MKEQKGKENHKIQN